MKYLFTVFFLIFSATIYVSAQTSLIIEGKSYTNADETWYGVNIARDVPTNLIFKNNSISSENISGYMLQAGDDIISATNNNLDGEVITGNKFTWNGTNMSCITHGLFTGNNINAVIKYNYLDLIPMGIIRKSSSNMSDTEGGIAYNIVKSGAVAINIKGISNIHIYNNTLYTDRSTSQTWRGLVYIYTNTDIVPNSISHNTKIFNNIFYTKYQTYCIQIGDQESLTGFESDYNIFYCEAGQPLFYYCGSVKTFTEWQALGFDKHSKVINPEFKDLINFVPSARLDYGTNLGSVWAEGLSVNAAWGTSDPETAMQNGTWQTGAVIYSDETTNQSPVISISSPTKSTAYTAPASITIDATASDPDGIITKVEFYNGNEKLGERTTSPWSFTWKEVEEGSYSLTATATDNSGSTTISAAVTVVVEKATTVVNQLPYVAIESPTDNFSYKAPATITVTATASDPDGSIIKVEYYNNDTKLGESVSSPFPFSFACDTAGTFEITAIAYDDLYATSVSEPVIISVISKSDYADLANVYPNPNNGCFTVDLENLQGYNEMTSTLSIYNLSGRTVYSDIIDPSETNRQIDISGSISGNYILVIKEQNKIITTRQFIIN